MNKTVIAEKKWAYSLYQSNDHYVLSVVCGGAAMYELNIPLNAAEIKMALESPASLEVLVEAIRSQPDSFASRSVNAG